MSYRWTCSTFLRLIPWNYVECTVAWWQFGYTSKLDAYVAKVSTSTQESVIPKRLGAVGANSIGSRRGFISGEIRRRQKCHNRGPLAPFVRLANFFKPSAAEISIKPRLLPDLRVLQVDDYFCNSPDFAAEFIRSRWSTSGVVSQPIEDRNQNNANDEEEETYVQPPKRQFLEVCISTPHHTGLAEDETVMRCIEEGFSFSVLSPGPSSVSESKLSQNGRWTAVLVIYS